MIWSREYLAYARAHGREPDEQAEHDDAAWPGGRACGFMLWVSARLRAAAEQGLPFVGRAPSVGVTVIDHEAWSRWLWDQGAAAADQTILLTPTKWSESGGADSASAL